MIEKSFTTSLHTIDPPEIDFLGYLIESSRIDGSIYFHFITLCHKTSIKRTLRITFVANDSKNGEKTLNPQLHYFLGLNGVFHLTKSMPPYSLIPAQTYLEHIFIILFSMSVGIEGKDV